MAEGQVMVMTADDIHKNLDGDKTGEFVNRYIRGEVVIGDPTKVQDTAQVSGGTTSSTVVTPITQGVPAASESATSTNVQDNAPVIDVSVEESDNSRYERLIETLREQQRGAEEKHVAEREELRKKYEEAKAEQVRIQRETEERKPASVGVDIPSGDENEYTSDYSKSNRKLIKELSDKIGELGQSNPEIERLKKQIRNIGDEFKRREDIERQARQLEQKNAQQKKMDAEIKILQNKYDRFQTGNDISNIKEQFGHFRNDLGYILNTNNSEELDAAVYDYFHGKTDRAEKLRLDSKNKGIVPPQDCERFLELASLVDLKNGIRFNPHTRKYEYITDELGQRVCYKSLESAYRDVYFDDILANARAQASREITQNVMQQHNSARVLDNKTTAPSSPSSLTMSKEDAMKYINLDPKSWRNNEELRDKVVMAYKMAGIAMPSLRGAI